MSIPMPLFERFAPGTWWQLTVGVGNWPAGSRVRVEDAPYEETNEMYVMVSYEGMTQPVSLSVLG